MAKKQEYKQKGRGGEGRGGDPTKPSIAFIKFTKFR
jgi:hypothetical protein